MIATFIMQSVAFISSPSQVRTKLIFPYNKRSYIFKSTFIAFELMTTYLKDLIQSIGRYGGLSWQETGFRFFYAQVVSLLSMNFWLAKDPKQEPHVGGSMTI